MRIRLEHLAFLNCSDSAKREMASGAKRKDEMGYKGNCFFRGVDITFILALNKILNKKILKKLREKERSGENGRASYRTV